MPNTFWYNGIEIGERRDGRSAEKQMEGSVFWGLEKFELNWWSRSRASQIFPDPQKQILITHFLSLGLQN